MKSLLTPGFALLLALAASTAAAAPSHQAPYALSLWNDPQFARYFVGTYAIMPEVEPTLAEKDRELLQGLLPLMPKPAEAMAYLAKVVTPGCNAIFDFQMASLYFDANMLDASEKWYKSAITKSPSFRRAWRGLGMAQVRAMKWKEAVASLGQAVALGIQDGPTYGLLGYALLSMERPSSAESAYRSALMFQPDSLDWKMGLIRTALKQMKAAEAASLCDEILRDHPDRADMLSLQAEAFLVMKETVKAAENLEILVRGGQAKGEDLARLGDIYLATKEPALAVSAYTRWIERSDRKLPEDVDKALQVAESLSAQNALTEAGIFLAKVKTTAGKELPKEAEARLLKVEARLQMSAGKGDTAAPILERVVELNPLDGGALMLLGQYYSDKKDNVSAVARYERAAKIKENEPDALIRLAQIKISEGKLAEALPDLKRSNDLKPRDSVQKLIQDVEKFLKKAAR